MVDSERGLVVGPYFFTRNACLTISYFAHACGLEVVDSPRYVAREEVRLLGLGGELRHSDLRAGRGYG